MAGVVFKNVYKRYGDNVVIRDLTFDIPDQAFVVIVGPSGCGKSTTLRMIAGLETISEGIVKIGDRVVNDVPPKDRDIAMVFQNYALYPHMNVYKNMEFGLKLRKFPKDEIDRRVQRASDILGIQDLLDRKPKQLSGGQRQRVAVGRAIVREPAVFLFDEPLSNLDAKLRVQMRSEIRKLHMKLKTTMVYVTHDQIEAMTMGDQIVILKDGILQQQGPPLEVYKKPNNLFVAGFIGSPAMNFVECKLDRVSEEVRLTSDVMSLTLPQEVISRFDLRKETTVILGIRPEDLWVIHEEDTPDLTGKFDAHVELVEVTGAETLIHIKTGDRFIVAKVSSDERLSEHTSITLGFNLMKIHLFSSQTHESLLVS